MNFIEPTIFVDVDPKARIAQEEILDRFSLYFLPKDLIMHSRLLIIRNMD